MQSRATTVKAYLASLPAERRAVVSAVRDVVNANLPDGYQEGMQYGMIGWYVPHSLYPAGYHCDPKQPLPYAGLAAQKNHYSMYMMCVYGDEAHKDWFEKAWQAAGKKLDIGKGCVRFKHLDGVPLDVVGQAIAATPVEKFVAFYEAAAYHPNNRAAKAARPAKARKSAATKSAAKATPAGKTKSPPKARTGAKSKPQRKAKPRSMAKPRSTPKRAPAKTAAKSAKRKAR